MRFVACRPQSSNLFNRFFDDELVSEIAKGQYWSPALDVIEEKEQYVLKADLPGLKKEDIKISVQDDILCIEGERKTEPITENKQIHSLERSYGRFVRHLNLGVNVDIAKIQANYKDGVLELTVPKSEEKKPKSIEVQVQ